MVWNAKSRGRTSGGSAPRGHRAYAIGDVHGRLDLLDELLAKVAADNSARGKARTTIVFLGDLIDRGPQSAQVVERLMAYRPAFAKPVFLMGNHEEVLLRILAGETDLILSWLQFGGVECARSYGIDPAALQVAGRAEAVAMLRQSIPKDHLRFFAGFADTASFGRYLFVHAGIRPGVPLANQLPYDLRWIRLPFLTDERDHGRIVVHGHSITEQVDVRANRIGIDTGAYRTGVLTALGLEGDDHWFLKTHADRSETERTASVANFSVAY